MDCCTANARLPSRCTRLAMMVKGKAQTGKRDEVRRLFEEHLAPRAARNPAQQIVVWCADAAEPDTFYLWEVYGDPAAMEASARAPWFGAYMAAVGPLLSGEPEVITATPAWIKPASI